MATTNIRTITTPDWQMSLKGLGETVEDFDDIAQCLRIIVTTRKGENPLRPLFGCGLFDYIDKPINVAKTGIVKSIAEAVALWETRVTVLSITPTMGDSSIAVDMEVLWNNKRQNIAIKIN